ncbi:MAG: hypothetical protein K0Q87_1706 [Neobacillus sp.]|jgi:DNA-directed RNA polymerase sigma subunit (sigma70/sigma32)|nr:hypothetical protein [Neobacillus sp.]
MRYAVSLESPVKGTEDLTLKDIIVDHMVEEDYRFIEDDAFWQDVHELLEETSLKVTSGSIQEALIKMLHENCTLLEACRRLDLNQDKQHSMYQKYNQALRFIRRYLRGQALKRCRLVGIDMAPG